MKPNVKDLTAEAKELARRLEALAVSLQAASGRIEAILDEPGKAPKAQQGQNRKK